MDTSQELKKYEPKARRILEDESKLRSLIDTVGDKIMSTLANNEKLAGAMAKVGLLVRMVKAYTNGSYRAMPWKAILTIVGGLLYFITPIDLIPDFIPVLGLVDDVTVILWIFKSFSYEVQAYEVWESENQPDHLAN